MLSRQRLTPPNPPPTPRNAQFGDLQHFDSDAHESLKKVLAYTLAVPAAEGGSAAAAAPPDVGGIDERLRAITKETQRAMRAQDRDKLRTLNSEKRALMQQRQELQQAAPPLREAEGVDLGLTFSAGVTSQVRGFQDVPLVPGGEHMAVTEVNKHKCVSAALL